MCLERGASTAATLGMVDFHVRMPAWQHLAPYPPICSQLFHAVDACCIESVRAVLVYVSESEPFSFYSFGCFE